TWICIAIPSRHTASEYYISGHGQRFAIQNQNVIATRFYLLSFHPDEGRDPFFSPRSVCQMDPGLRRDGALGRNGRGFQDHLGIGGGSSTAIVPDLSEGRAAWGGLRARWRW